MSLLLPVLIREIKYVVHYDKNFLNESGRNEIRYKYILA